ncbi:MAG: Ig-like domain-containing protein [Pseudomonadota bacterium]
MQDPDRLPGFAEDVAVIDQLDLVAVALGDGGVAVVDVRDPIRPALDAVYADLTVTQVVAVGDRLIIGQDGRIKIIDAASGVELASVGVGVGPDQQFSALAFEDGQIYALGDNGTLHVVSLDGTSLQNRGVINVLPELLDPPVSPQIATQDGVLWIGTDGDGASNSTQRGGMITVDATDPDAPSIVGTFNLSNTASDFAGDSVALNGSGFGTAARTLFDTGTNSRSRLTVFDSRDPSDVENEVTEYQFEGQVNDISIANGEAFVATGSEGLQIVRFLGIDTQGLAPEIEVATLPEDVDDAVAGLQVFQGQTVRFDVMTDDDIQVSRVDVLINDIQILSTVAHPWDLTVTLPTIEDLGTDQLSVQFRATDTGGNATLTDPVLIQMVEDVTPFEILDITPDDGASLLPGSVRSVTVTFSKSVETDTVNADTFELTGPGGVVLPASISVRESGTEVQLTYPADAFGSGAFTLTIDADMVTDRADTPLAVADVTSSFDIQVISGQTWIATSDGTWNDPVNWSTGSTPQPGDDVVVPLLSGVTATVSATAGDVNSLNISGDGLFLVNSADAGTTFGTDTLSNTGTVDVARGRVDISSETANSGTLGASGTPGTNSSGQPVTFIGELSLTGALTNTGVLLAEEGGRVELEDASIENQGEIRVENVAGDTRETTIQTTGALTELTGGGTVTFVNGDGATNTPSVIGSVGTAQQGVIDETFRNVDNTITGTGDIGAGFVLENGAAGLIEARDGDTLRITSGRVDNDGTIQALSGGTLNFDSEQFAFFGGIFAFRTSTFIDNRDGVILANGGQVNFTDSTISGGLLQASNGGFFTIASTGGNGFPRIDGQVEAVTIQGTMIASSLVQTAGTIDNQGVLTTSLGASFGTELQIIEDTIFTGGGQINLFSGDVASNDRVATIFNDFAVLFDENTGEVLFDEFGQVQVEYETRLTLQEQRLTGSGRIGVSEGEAQFAVEGDPGKEIENGGGFGEQPLFKIDVEGGSSIDANQPGQLLEFLNTEVNLSAGASMQASGGILRMIDSDLYNFGAIDIFSGGEMSLERGDGASTGGFFYNDTVGQLNLFDGFLFSDVSVFNRGQINILGGEADLNSITDDGSTGGVTSVGDAVLNIRNGGSSFIDVALGDAEVIIENTVNLSATLADFEIGDTFHFTDLDDSGAFSLNFFGTGNNGTLTIDDGFTTLSLELLTGGDYSGATEADFLLSSSDFGGLKLETVLDFI